MSPALKRYFCRHFSASFLSLQIARDCSDLTTPTCRLLRDVALKARCTILTSVQLTQLAEGFVPQQNHSIPGTKPSTLLPRLAPWNAPWESVSRQIATLRRQGNTAPALRGLQIDNLQILNWQFAIGKA